MSLDFSRDDLVFLLLSRKYFFIHGKSKTELLMLSYEELEDLLDECKRKLKVMKP